MSEPQPRLSLEERRRLAIPGVERNLMGRQPMSHAMLSSDRFAQFRPLAGAGLGFGTGLS